MKDPNEVPIDPAIGLENGRSIRTLADAIAFVREHEARPGIDDRDEVLHQLERAETDEERAKAVERFRAWLADWGVTIPVSGIPNLTGYLRRRGDPPK
jgi:hypothetical protein